MDGIYERNGQKHSNFNSGRFEKYDQQGRDNLSQFFTYKGGKVKINDRKKDGTTDYTKADMLVEMGGHTWEAEAAVKSDSLWKFIKDGVDIETRKFKYLKNNNRRAVLVMSNSSNTELLVIPMECLLAAQNSCGKEYKGHRGRKGNVLNSEGFVMPPHGCHRVRKMCSDSYTGVTEEDFFRIPYKYVSHYKVIKPGVQYELIQASSWANRSKNG
jgi:hypothetical protein